MLEPLPDAGAVPIAQPSPAGDAASAAHFLREHLPGDAALQDEDDARQAGPVGHRRTPALGLRSLPWEQRLDDLPQLVGYQWSSHAPPPCNFYAPVLKGALRQVLLNLLSNASKFTDAGRRIGLSCYEDGEHVHLSVRDTGLGIPEDKLVSIFEPFVQVRSDLTRTAEGTGLGLAISRYLARGMGGDLSVESALGKGSTFTLTLPAA